MCHDKVNITVFLHRQMTNYKNVNTAFLQMADLFYS